MPVKPDRRAGKATGRWVADVQDRSAGLPRTRRTFATKKEAQEWEAYARHEGHKHRLGQRHTRTFGEALVRYCEEILPHKKSAASEAQHHLVTLRWPFLHDGRFIRLEEVPLESGPGQLAIVPAMASWRADLLAIVRRSRLDGQHYQQRRTPKGLHWFHQAAGEGDHPPPPRRLVRDPALRARLDAAPGAGPYRPDTLRIRQSLVKAILRHAWRWDWLSQDLSSKLTTERPAPGREHFLTRRQRGRLLRAAARSDYGIHFAHLVWAACILGLRRANLVGLTWAHVHWPEAGRIGTVIFGAGEMKAGRAHALPMTAALERLLRKRAAHARGDYVFHDGRGRPWGNFRKTWITCVKAAGLPEGYRWHDLRHAWASFLLQAGASTRDLQELGGWNSPAMPNRYAHRATEHLLTAASLAAQPDQKPK